MDQITPGSDRQESTATQSPPPTAPGQMGTMQPPPESGPGPSAAFLAEWWKRLVALIIDTVIVGVPTWILQAIFTIGSVRNLKIDPATGQFSGRPGFMAANFGIGIFGAIIGVVYYTYLHGSRGQTLGKMALKIKVVDETGGFVIGYGRAFVRWLLPALFAIPCGIPWLLDGLWPLWDAKRQSWHDKIVRTLVIDVT